MEEYWPTLNHLTTNLYFAGLAATAVCGSNYSSNPAVRRAAQQTEAEAEAEAAKTNFSAISTACFMTHVGNSKQPYKLSRYVVLQ